ncbi:MAG: hypothetical protein Q4A78_00385 [Peptostreptococcaceae bacterium]|nr:hypothetical protein [Peptostreptococcaceae bacterium]
MERSKGIKELRFEGPQLGFGERLPEAQLIKRKAGIKRGSKDESERMPQVFEI